MAISSDQNRVAYSGDGSSAVFNFQYEFHAESDLGVFIYNSSRPTFIVEQVLNTDYTVSGDQDTQDRFLNGANVVMNSSPATGDEIVIFRSSAVNSVFTLPFTGTIPSAELVKALDRLTLLAQRLNDQVTRSVRLDDAYPFAFDTKLPENLTPGAPLIVNSGATGVAFGVVAAGSSFLGILPMVNGGTGVNLTPAIGDLLYADSTTTMGLRTAGNPGEILMAKGAAAPQYEKINVGSSEQITGVLPYTAGGTGTGAAGGQDVPLVGQNGDAPIYQPLNMASGSSVTGALGIANGGTGQTTKQTAFDALSPLTTKADIVVFGTGNVGARLAVGADGTFLKADSSTPSGFVYDTPGLGNLTIVLKTHQDSPYEVDTTDKSVMVNADSSAVVVQLYDAPGNSGNTVYVKKTDASNIVTVVGSASQLIDGTSQVLHQQYESLRMISDGTNWNVVADSIPKKTMTIQTFNSSVPVGTYTTPSPKPVYIKVRMIGGGGGGSGISNGVGYVSGENGSSTVFGSITAAAGGGAANEAPGAGGFGGGGSADLRIPGGQGQGGSAVSNTVPGSQGGNGVFGGGGAGGVSASNGADGADDSGAGGGGSGGNTAWSAGPMAGGGAGEYAETIIANPAATYAYTVGAGGPGADGTSADGGNGGPGKIIVEEYY